MSLRWPPPPSLEISLSPCSSHHSFLPIDTMETRKTKPQNSLLQESSRLACTQTITRALDKMPRGEFHPASMHSCPRHVAWISSWRSINKPQTLLKGSWPGLSQDVKSQTRRAEEYPDQRTPKRCSPVVQGVKDLALSLQRQWTILGLGTSTVPKK